MSEPRPIRDRLGELMRLARIDGVQPWDRLTEDCREEWRRSADRLLRLAADRGVTIEAEAEPLPIPQPAGPVIERYTVTAQNAERHLRAGAGVWEVVKIADGQEIILHRFTMQGAALKAGRALVADATVAKEPAVLTELAAALTVLRLDAAGLEFRQEVSDAA